MQSDKIKRYPGGRPFTKDMAKLFFGRKEDLKKLHQLVSLEKLVVLHGRSGLGKSSLINAGLIPKLQEDPNNECIQFRFNAWTESSKKTPLKTTLESLENVQGDASIISKIIPSDDSVWRIIKERQFKAPDSRQVLIFDQFEELFSYPNAEVHQFKSQIAELIRKQLPKRFEQILNIAYNRGQDVITVDEEDALYKELNVRILFIIRSDKMHLLDQLSDYLPTIFKNNHELKALQIGGATDAIIKPASLEGDHFISNKFSYTSAAQNKIIDFLQDKDTQLIEAIQLQIVCTSFEENVISKGWTELDENNIGDLNAIVQNYYHNKLETLDTKEEKLQAARLLEDGLVDNQRKQRLTLHESQIFDLFKVDQELLNKLINIHLLRRELDQNGGYNYELSHDTLIGPALMAKELREQKENEEERIRQQKELAQERAKRRRANLFSYAMVALALISAFSFFRQYMQSKELIKKEVMLEDQNNELEKQFNALTASEEARLIALQEARDNEDEAKNQAAEANRQKIEANRQKKEAIKKTIEAEARRKEALDAQELANEQTILAKNAKNEALDNYNKAVASEKKSRILSLISQAKFLFSQGKRAKALLITKELWKLDPEREEVHLLIKEMARSPMPIVYADHSTKPRMMHSTEDLIITSTFIFNPKTQICTNIESDELLLSDDEKYILGITYHQNSNQSYHFSHRNQGTLENFKKAKYQLFETRTLENISSFQYEDIKDPKSQLGEGYDKLPDGDIVSTFPGTSCFLALDDKKEKILSIKEIKSDFFNSAIWQLSDAKDKKIISSFGNKYSPDKIGKRDNINFNTKPMQSLSNDVSAETGLMLNFETKSGNQLLSFPSSQLTYEHRNELSSENDDDLCIIKNTLLRMDDYASIPIVEFKVDVEYCYESPYVIETLEAVNPCDFQYVGRGFDEQITEGTALHRSYHFSENHPYALFWDEAGNAGIWDLNEIRIADFLPGSYHGYTWAKDEQLILTKYGNTVYIWDVKGRLIKEIEAKILHMYSLDQYLLLKENGEAYKVYNGVSQTIDGPIVENFAGFTEKGFITYDVLSGFSVGGATDWAIKKEVFEWNKDAAISSNEFQKSVNGDYRFNYSDSIPDSIAEEVYTTINKKQISIWTDEGNEKQLVDAFSLQDFVYQHFYIDNNLVIITEDRKVKIFPIQLNFDPEKYLGSKMIGWK